MRIPKIYVNFTNENDRFGDRKKSLSTIPKNLLVINNAFVPRTTNWLNIKKFTFVLSPFGNGMDCHRTWEALSLGSIPIIKGNGFSNLPNPINIDPRKIDNAQTIKFTCGMRKDDRVFNPEDTLKSGTLSAAFYLNKYDAEFMSESRQKDVTKEFCSKIGVIRNLW